LNFVFFLWTAITWYISAI